MKRIKKIKKLGYIIFAALIFIFVLGYYIFIKEIVFTSLDGFYIVVAIFLIGNSILNRRNAISREKLKENKILEGIIASKRKKDF